MIRFKQLQHVTLLILVSVALTSGISCNQANDPMLDMLDTQLANLKVDSLTL